MVVELDNFWWEDSSCLASEVQHNVVAVICQYDSAVASTTTTSAAPTTTTTVTTTTTEVTTTTVKTTVTPGNSCPSGWQEFRGHCYLVSKSKATWADAEKDCVNKGGHLASIHSADENSFIRSLYPSNWLWIGGTDVDVEVGFTI